MSKVLPLVQLSVLRPLVQGLRERGIDPEPVLENVGLTEAAIESEGSSVHVMVVHQFTEACAKAVDDPTFCASVGSRLDPNGWPMIAAAKQRALSLGDFLNIYVSQSNDVATSVTAYLEVRGDSAYFGEERVFRPTITPAQNDGFMISLALSMLEQSLGSRLDPGRMVLVVCDPSVLPERFREFQVLRGDRMGFRIQFPSHWLALPLEGAITSRDDREQDDGVIDAEFLAGFRGLLRRHIGHGGLNADAAAELVAMSRWQLARQLTSQGTDISTELKRAKWDVAKERLIHAEQTIEEISSALGYSDPANFSRAFAREFQQTPSKFRRAQRTQAT
jgi:AraC-like DNA-binding protein